MTSFAMHTDNDPSGLNGERLYRNEKQAPYIEELYSYSTTIAFETIQAAWLKAFPRARHLTGVRTEGVRGGKRLIRIDRVEIEPKPLHIDEPIDV